MSHSHPYSSDFHSNRVSDQYFVQLQVLRAEKQHVMNGYANH